MATTFQVDTERIQNASVDISRISGDIESDVQAMMTRLTGLQDAWTGGAAARFQDLIQQWQTTQRQVHDSLEAIGTVLHHAAAQYAEVEAANERMFTVS